MTAQHSPLVLVVAALFVALALPLAGQLPTEGEARGVVYDPSGALVPHATVTLTDTATGASRVEETKEDGSYLFPSVIPGRYNLTVNAKGFSVITVRDLVVLVGKTTSQDAHLSLSRTTEAVEVTAAPPLIQNTRSDLGDVIERKQLDSLPLKTRDFSDLATLVPQVVRTPIIDPTKSRVTNISVAGTGGRQSNVFVDGFENFDVVVGGLAYDVSPDAIQEFNVVTTRFTAEQARSNGAVINIVQRSGTNNFHGDAFYFFRNQDLTARDFFQTHKSTFRRQQQGGTLGGPLKKDRLFGFVAFEDHRERDTGVVNTRGVYPQFEGSFPLPFHRDLATLKIDAVANAKHRIFYRYNLDHFIAAEDVGGIRAFSNGENNKTTTQSHGFSHTWVPASNKVNTLGFQIFRFENRLAQFSDIPNQVRPDLIIGTRVGDPQGTSETRYQLRDDFAFTHGQHSIKIGGEYHHVRGSAFLFFATTGSFTFFNDAPINAQFADLLVQSACNVPNCQLGDLKSEIAGLYVHDDWKVLPNLTLNIGVRWDYYSNQNDKNFDGILGLLAPPGSRTSDKTDFAPRLGFAYDPFKTGKLVLRGGYGIYYQNLNLLDGLVEHGLDGRNIGFRVFFNPGGININNPFPGLTPQQVHDMFFGPPQDPLIALDNKFHTPYNQVSSAGLQWSFAPNFAMSLDGIHVLGLKGIVARDANVDPNFNIATTGSPLCQQFGSSVCQQFGPVPLSSNGNRLHYNALVASLTKALSHRFQFNTSYTYAKAEDLYDDSVGGGGALLSNPFNYVVDRGPAVTDQRHHFIFNGIMDPSGVPPFFGKSWEVALISSFATPLPYSIVSASPAADGLTPVRPPGIGRNAGNRGSQDHLLTLINAFRTRQGLAPITRKLTPESMNVRSTDLRLSKGFRLGERFQLRLQGEVFNLFNHANFISNGGNALFGATGINGVAESDTVGLPSSTPGLLGPGGPRAFQFSARLHW